MSSMRRNASFRAPSAPTSPKSERPTYSFHENSQEARNTDRRDDRPTPLWRYRTTLREYAAEFTGVMMLVIFGTGGACQVTLSSNDAVSASPKGEYLSIAFGYAVGLSIGGWVSGGYSGGHINPAVTLAMATFRGFPWRKVPGYIFAQLLGGIVGAAIIYGIYFNAISIFEGGTHVRTLKTAGLFGTFALPIVSNVSAFFAEFVGAAILVFVIFAVTDTGNSPPPNGLLPLVLFIVLLGIGSCIGMSTGFAVNPARDLGPRILTSMVGYGSPVYSFRSQYWIWCPIMAPILGGLVAAFLYDVFLYNGDDNVVKRLCTRKKGNSSKNLV